MAANRAGNGPFDIPAILKDYRNWRGVDGQKDQALLWLVHDLDRDQDETHNGMMRLRLATVEDYTGIQRATALPLLQSLAERGFIHFEAIGAGTSRATYWAKLRNRNVGNWPITQHHRKPVPKNSPF